MIENRDTEQTRSRLIRVAKLLKAYYEHKFNLSLELLLEAPIEPLAEGFQFDLKVSACGIWGLRSTMPIEEKIQAEISATFHNLLAAVGSLEERRRDLAWLQETLEFASREGAGTAGDDNVIPMHRFLSTRTRGFSRIDDKRWILRLDCLIESAHISEIHKMALEMHMHSQRAAFVDYRDLDKRLRKDLDEIMGLGPITIFVPNILDLSLIEQEVLFQLIDRHTLQRPLLMVGASLPYSDLRSETAIHLRFLVALSRAYIKLTRPFSEYKEKGLIHYFLDSLAQSPT